MRVHDQEAIVQVTSIRGLGQPNPEARTSAANALVTTRVDVARICTAGIPTQWHFGRSVWLVRPDVEAEDHEAVFGKLANGLYGERERPSHLAIRFPRSPLPAAVC